MRTRVVRRVVSLSTVLMTMALIGAPAVAADENVAPSVTSTVSNPNPKEPQTVVASATFTDPESATETYTCTIDYGDGTPWVSGVVSGMTCTGPEHRYTRTGSYVISVFVTDSGGAMGVWMTGANYTNIGPWVGGLGLVGDHQVNRTAHAVTAIEDPGAAFETYTCTIDYGDGSSILPGTYVPDWPADHIPRCVFPDHVYTAIGTYTLTAVVTDSGGASGSARFNETIVSEITPKVTAPADQTVHSAQDAFYMGWHDYILGSFTDPNGAAAGPWTVTVDWGDGNLDTLTATSQGALKAGHVYRPGPHQVHVVVKNKAGLWSDAFFNTTLIDDGPTVVFASAEIEVTEGVPSAIVTGFYDPSPDGPFAFHMDWGDGTSQDLSTSTMGPISLTHTYAASDWRAPNIPVTEYFATATVTDSHGVANSAPLHVYVGDQMPVVTAIPVSVPEGFSGNVTIASFTDASVAPWDVYVWNYSGFYLHFQVQAPGPIQIPYDWSMGSSTFQVVVADRGGWGSDTVQVTVTATYESPVVGPVQVGPLTEGSPVIAVATFTDRGMQGGPGTTPETYGCSVDYGDGSGQEMGVVSGATCTGPAHSYPGAGVGTHTVTVYVWDSHGIGSASLAITIPNTAPTITSNTTPALTTVGVDINAFAVFSDPGMFTGNPPETYECTVDYGDGSGPQAGMIVGNGCSGPAHAYSQQGSYTVTVQVIDWLGGIGVSSSQITVVNPAPVVGAVSAPDVVDEGSSVAASAQFDAAGQGQTYTCTVDYGDGSGPLAGVVTASTCQGPSHKFGRTGAYTITVAVTDSAGASGSASKLISVANVPPTITEMSMVSLAKVGSTVKVAASFSDPGTGESYQATWDWGDGRTSVVSLGSSPGSFSASHTYTKAGLYEVWLTVGDGSGSTVASRSLVVYDPARTLAGSGSVASPAGACRLSTRCGTASTATFSISAKYGKTSKPTVGVCFSAKDFSFSATSADWFVAADGTAVIQGTGKVNGLSGYSFFLVAVDGRPDTLRLSVFNTAGNIVYDISSRPLKSGSISIK